MQVQKSILILIICLVCLASYFNALSASFVWDDSILINDNPYIRSFKFLNLFFTQDIWHVGKHRINSGYYRPLLAATFMLDYAIWQAKPFGYHLTNLIFHGLVCILLFLLVEKLFKNRVVSFFSALLFAAHPIHVEAVSFISGRVDIFCLLFFLLSLLLFLEFVSRKKIIFYLFSLFCFLISLLVKEMAVTLPLIVIFMDYLFISNQRYKSVLKNFLRLHLGFFIILAAYFLMRNSFVGWEFLKFKGISSGNFIYGTGYFWRFFTVMKILYYYTRLLIVPFGLNADYILAPSSSLFAVPVLSGILVLLGLTFIAIKSLKERPILTFAIGWFFITWLPVSNIMPIGNIFSDRFMYTPSVSYCIAIAFMFFYLSKLKIKTNLLNWGKSVLFIFFLLVICFGRVTFERNKVWHNDYTLWYETAKATPWSKRAHLNLGNEYLEADMFDKAIEEYNKALRIVSLPRLNYEILNNVGNLYLEKEMLGEAIKAYKIAISIAPEEALAYSNLSSAYGLKGQYKESIEAAKIALKNNPYLFTSHVNLGISYTKLGRINEAIKEYETYLQLQPKDPYVNVELGYLYYKQNNFQKAKFHWLEALKIAKDYKPAIEALKLLKDQPKKWR